MKKFASFIALLALLCTAADSQALTTVSSDITSNTTWSGEVLLEAVIFVKAPATLTIQPGTTIMGNSSAKAALVIDRGAKINAVGTPASPIVFTSDKTVKGKGDWGGLILNGYSQLNVTGGYKVGEGDTGTFGCGDGGTTCNDADNSGTLQYVRVEYAGYQISSTNEFNGIAFQGTGSGTTVDHVQVLHAKDDCIEFFGGTTNIKYAIMTACGDDSFDWTDGWRGKGQFLIAQQKSDEANHGIEADNLEGSNDNTPRSAPTLYNMTLVGHDNATATNPLTTGNGMLLRRGTAGNIRNSIITQFNVAGCDINDTATFNQVTGGNLIVDNNIFYGNKKTYADDTVSSMGANNSTLDPKLGAPQNLTAPDFRPGAGSPAIDGTVTVAALPTSDNFFTAANFIGAVDPNNDWTRQPWTTYGTASWTTTDNCTDAEKVTYYRDADNDTYGNASVTTQACEAPAGYVTNSTDCDDSDATCHTGDCCDNGTTEDCVMTVKPASISKNILTWFFPFRVYVLTGDDQADFQASDKPDWGDAPGIITLTSRVTRKDELRGVIILRPRLLESGSYDITAGNCAGSIEIK